MEVFFTFKTIHVLSRHKLAARDVACRIFREAKTSPKPNFKTKNIHFGKSRIAENCKKGDPLGFLKIQSVAKYLNN